MVPGHVALLVSDARTVKLARRRRAPPLGGRGIRDGRPALSRRRLRRRILVEFIANDVVDKDLLAADIYFRAGHDLSPHASVRDQPALAISRTSCP